MDKNDLTEMYLRKTGPRTNDMRPRFDDQTYVGVLEISAESSIARNVVVMAIVKLWMAENAHLSAGEKFQRLLRTVENS